MSLRSRLLHSDFLTKKRAEFLRRTTLFRRASCKDVAGIQQDDLLDAGQQLFEMMCHKNQSYAVRRELLDRFQKLVRGDNIQTTCWFIKD